MDAVTMERFHLAYQLRMTVAELEEKVSVSELLGWRRYFKEANNGKH